MAKTLASGMALGAQATADLPDLHSWVVLLAFQVGVRLHAGTASVA